MWNGKKNVSTSLKEKQEQKKGCGVEEEYARKTREASIRSGERCRSNEQRRREEGWMKRKGKRKKKNRQKGGRDRASRGIKSRRDEVGGVQLIKRRTEGWGKGEEGQAEERGRWNRLSRSEVGVMCYSSRAEEEEEEETKERAGR